MTTVKCLQVRRRLQEYFDRSPAAPLHIADPDPPALAPPDAAHLRSCGRCGELYRRYARFQTALRSGALEELAKLEPPDWQAVLVEGPPSDPATLALPHRGVGRAGRRRAAVRARAARNRAPLVSLRRAPAAAAALLLAAAGISAFVGYHRHRAAETRDLIRSDTAAFVNSLFAAPFFPAPPETAASFGLDSSWFDATGGSTLPPAPGAGSPAGQATAPSSVP